VPNKKRLMFVKKKKPKPTWRILRPAIISCHGNVTDIAKHFEVSRRTAYNWLSKDLTGKIKACVSEARDGLLDTAEKKLSDKIIDGNLSAVIFYLKCLGKQRGYVERTVSDISGEISVSIVNKTITCKEDLPDDQH